ncbi:MAG: hypothetical protein KDA96_23900 [Planctomycetaceae bacterium]|nr:hypothetical protein [Planctomycetaceae bacterium]
MKGPSLQYDLRVFRVFECPSCHRTVQVPGAVTWRECVCSDPPVRMQLCLPSKDFVFDATPFVSEIESEFDEEPDDVVEEPIVSETSGDAAEDARVTVHPVNEVSSGGHAETIVHQPEAATSPEFGTGLELDKADAGTREGDMHLLPDPVRREHVAENGAAADADDDGPSESQNDGATDRDTRRRGGKRRGRRDQNRGPRETPRPSHRTGNAAADSPPDDSSGAPSGAPSDHASRPPAGPELRGSDAGGSDAGGSGRRKSRRRRGGSRRERPDGEGRPSEGNG